MPKAKIHNMPQGSDEWHEIRLGRMTASHAQCIGACGTGLQTYALELTAEILTGKAKDHFYNEHMQRGNDLEPMARAMYEIETGNVVTEIGFATYGKYAGCSPDGLICSDGGLEIKSPSDKVFLQFLLDGKINTKHIAQMQMCMLVLNRKWWDYTLYNENFEKSLIITRVFPDQEKQDKIKAGLKLGEDMIELNLKKIKEMK